MRTNPMRNARAELTLHSRCGMRTVLAETRFRIDVGSLRSDAAARLRAARRMGLIAYPLERGRRWEMESPEDAGSVSDWDGVLTLSEPAEGMLGDDEDQEDQEAWEAMEDSMDEAEEAEEEEDDE